MVRAALSRTGLLALGAAALAGCTVDAFTYTIDRYGTVKARQVHLACHDTYEIYDRPDAGTILVVTNALNEAMASACDEPSSATLPKPERMRRVAKIFLEETTDRPECGITRENPVTDLHTEFSYKCPAPATRKAVAVTPKRR
jgi:hypothetical protein